MVDCRRVFSHHEVGEGGLLTFSSFFHIQFYMSPWLGLWRGWENLPFSYVGGLLALS
jgi:hypothetical protein